MATTATKIQETLLQDAGSTAGAESAGSAAGAYRSDEEILGIGDSATGAGTSEQTSRAGDEKDALGAQASEGKERTRNTEDTENTEGTEKSDKRDKTESGAPTEIPAEFEQIFATPGTGEKLREIYQREAEYRAIFPTIGEARALREAFATAEDAKAAIEARHELARVDALVESGDPEAHVELMTGIRERDPRAFRRLAQTFAERLAEVDPVAYRSVASRILGARLVEADWPERLGLLARAAEKQDLGAVKFLAGQLAAQIEEWKQPLPSHGPAYGGGQAHVLTPRDAQLAEQELANAEREAHSRLATMNGFLQAANAEVEQTVRQAVDGKVAQLLPEAADGARGKIAAEIYRELDAALKNDHGLLDQVKSGLANLQQNGNTGAQQAKSLALLIANRAKALLPGVARRVVGEWTSTVLSASQAKRTKQAAAASRADVGIGGAPGPVAVRPARISYGTMSDEDILNAE